MMKHTIGYPHHTVQINEAGFSLLADVDTRKGEMLRLCRRFKTVYPGITHNPIKRIKGHNVIAPHCWNDMMLFPMGSDLDLVIDVESSLISWLEDQPQTAHKLVSSASRKCQRSDNLYLYLLGSRTHDKATVKAFYLAERCRKRAGKSTGYTF
jgi:hypothetical protein